ncbi:MAG: hypothetical protein EBT63_06250 [Proteobacteria bacterium]|nr:hypothetical protein [Pseudomonadota bacterium]NCA28654.1 hypothetical protein [Pseudomonadota bacterium]
MKNLPIKPIDINSSFDHKKSTQNPDNSNSENAEIIESNQFNTKKIDEDNTRFGDWVIKGQAIDF